MADQIINEYGTPTALAQCAAAAAAAEVNATEAIAAKTATLAAAEAAEVNATEAIAAKTATLAAAEAAALLVDTVFFATKALMDADLVHNAGVVARVTNDATTANNIYYTKSGASGTGSWTSWAALYIPDCTVTAPKISPLAVTRSKINSDVSAKFTGEKYNYKCLTGTTAMVQYSFDGLGLTSSDAMAVAYDLFSDDANIASYKAIVYLGNDPTDLIEAGTVIGSTAFVPGEIRHYAATHRNFNPTYRYIQVLIQLTFTTNQFTVFSIRNVTVTAGGSQKPLVKILMVNRHTDSTVTPVDYLDTNLMTAANTDEICTQTINSRSKNWDRTHTKTDTSKGPAAYLLFSVLFDLEPYTDLVGQSGVSINFDMLSESQNIKGIYSSLYITNNDINGLLVAPYTDLLPGGTAQVQYWLAGTEQNITNTAAITFANASNYKYLQALVIVNIANTSLYYDIDFANPTLTIGTEVISSVSGFALYASAMADSYLVSSLTDTDLVNYKTLQDGLAAKLSVSDYAQSGALYGAGGLAGWYKSDKISRSIAIVGDSTSDKTMVSPLPPAVEIYNQVEKYYINSGDGLGGCTILDFGAAGNKLSDFLADTNAPSKGITAAIAAHADMYIISYGINDVRNGALTLAQFKALLVTAVETILAQTSGYILLRTPNGFLSDTREAETGWVSPGGSEQTYADLLYNAYDYFRNRYNRVEVIDMQTRIFGRTVNTLANSPYMQDKIHPNETGYKAIADELAEFLLIPKPVVPWKSRTALTADPTAPWTTYPKILENGNYRRVTSGYFVGLTSTYLEFESYSSEAAKIQVGDIVKIGDARAFVVSGTVSNNGTNVRITQTFADTTNDAGMVTVYRNE
ncbi:MAG: SGNH/GDSL hydrolase family protein [Negativicutes bacterium]